MTLSMELYNIAVCKIIISDPAAYQALAWFQLEMSGITREVMQEMVSAGEWLGEPPLFDMAPPRDGGMWQYMLAAKREKAMTTPLEKSILHWEQNVAAETPDGASVLASDCALCLVHYDYWRGSCMWCPVALHTGKNGCRDTPYGDACDAYEAWLEDPFYLVAKAAFHDAAQAELDFLKSLRPKETT